LSPGGIQLGGSVAMVTQTYDIDIVQLCRKFRESVFGDVKLQKRNNTLDSWPLPWGVSYHSNATCL
jgi:hypothetical protein